MPALEVADDASWLQAFGVLPQTEEVSGDDYVRELRIPTGPAEELHVTWDVTDDSVRVRHEMDGRMVLDLYRELSTRLLVDRHGGRTSLVVEYGAPEAIGRTRIQVIPAVVVEDTLLRG